MQSPTWLRHLRAWSLLVVVTAAAMTGAGTVSAETWESIAEYRYTGPGVGKGDIAGSCDATGALFPSGAGSLVLQGSGARLERTTTTVTFTSFWPDDPNGWVAEHPDPEQERSTEPVPAGDLEIAWPETGLALLGNHDYPAKSGGLKVLFEGDRVEWSALQVVTEGSGFYKEDGEGGAAWWTGGFRGWNRLLQNDGQAMAQGDLTLYLREATLSGTRYERALGPWSEVVEETRDPTGTVRHYKMAFHDTMLRVQDARLTLPTDTRIVCGPIVFDIDGAVSLSQASGLLRHTGSEESIRFEGRVLNLDGTFDINESSMADQEGPATHVAGVAQGRFDAVGFDFRVEPVAGESSFVEKAVLGSILIAVLVALWKPLSYIWLGFYTRIRPAAVLEHPERGLLLEYLRANPGSPQGEIAATLGISRGGLLYHLAVLERSDHVRSIQVPGGKIYALTDLPREQALQRWAEGDERFQSILSWLEAGPILRSAIIAEARERFDVAYQTVRKWMDHLERAGLVAKEGSGKKVTYRAARF